MSAHICRSFSILQKTTTKSDLQLAKYSSILHFCTERWNMTFGNKCNICLICVFFNRQHSVQITNSRRRLGLNLKPKPVNMQVHNSINYLTWVTSQTLCWHMTPVTSHNWIAILHLVTMLCAYLQMTKKRWQRKGKVKENLVTKTERENSLSPVTGL